MIVLREAVSGAADEKDEQEAQRLLGRALYVAGRFEDALELFRRLAIVDERHQRHHGAGGKAGSPRHTALYAQALVCHGMLLERSDLHHNRLAQGVEHAGFPDDPGLPLSLFRRAAQLYLGQIEHTKRTPVLPGSSQTSSDSDCQYAIHRTIMLLAVAGEVNEALAVSKRSLRTALPVAFRLHILQCASTLLIRTLSKPTGTYGDSGSNDGGSGSSGGGGGGRGGSSRGGRNHGNSRNSASHFIANTEDEEAILLLLLEMYTLETQAAGGFGPSPPSSSAEDDALEETACRICNAAWLVLPRYNRFQAVSDVCEKAMVMRHCRRAQFALASALACAARRGRALLVLKQSSSWAARDPDVLLLGAMLHLKEEQHDQCYLLAEKVYKCDPVNHRAQHLMGVCKLSESRRPQPIPNRLDVQSTAMQLLQSACSGDPQSGTYMFNCAVACVEARDMAMAEHYAKEATRLKHGRPTFMCLLALVWAARAKVDAAVFTCQAAAHENPDCLLPMQLMSRIVQKLYGAGQALALHQAVLLELATHRNQASALAKTDPHFAGPQYELLTQRVGISRSASSQDNTASVLSSVLTMQAPTRSSSTSKSAAQNQEAVRPHVDVWLQIANCFLALERFQDCESCIAEARAFGVPSADVESCAGSLAAVRGTQAGSKGETAKRSEPGHSQGGSSRGSGDARGGSSSSDGGGIANVGSGAAAARYFAEAQQLYDRALTIDPTHVQSLVGHARILMEQGFNLNAQAVLEEAVTMDPYCVEAWRCLGKALCDRGDQKEGAECLLTALELEGPTVPMSASKLPVSLF